MEAAACHITRLPEDLLEAIISRTLPSDAVSQDFLAAAGSDAAWSRFLPRDLPRFVDAAERSLMALPSYKARFLRLSDEPALLLGTTDMRIWLDRATTGKCYALAARALEISWDDTPGHWRFENLDVLRDIRTGKRITSEAAQAAQLLSDNWSEISGQIEMNMLSRNCSYGAYLVFRLEHRGRGRGFPLQEASVSIGENVSTRRVCLHGYGKDGADIVVSRKYVEDTTKIWTPMLPIALVEDDVVLPRRRADGWMELELADGFYIHKTDDGEVCVSLNEKKGIYKFCLTTWSIEIRIKHQGI